MIKIGGAIVEYVNDTLDIDEAIGERSTASFDCVGLATAPHFQQGQQVEVFDDVTAELIYAGVVDKPKEKFLTDAGKIHYQIDCKDWHYLADKRRIAKAYEDTYAGAIVIDMLNIYLTDEGVSADTSNIQNGPNIVEAVFNYVKITDAIEALAEKAGFIWYIDEVKVLHFRARDTNVAPWTMTRADALKNSISLEVGNPSYRNKQYIKGGRDITDPMDEFKAGDGKTRAWTTGFPIAKEPTILVNGVAVLASDVGIKSVETGKKFYWAKGDPVFIQADNQPLLTSADTIKITYQGEFDIIAITYDGDQIEQRMNIEGNSGINEDVADEMANTNREASFQSANAKIKKYAVVGKRLKFSTIRSGLKAGQLLTVDLPEHELNNAEMLIESVQISIVKDHTIYNVACAEGPEQNSWAKMFGAMATRGQAFIVRKNISEKEILIVLEQFTKTWELADSPNIFKEVYASDTLYPADTLYPMFAYADRIRYVEIIDNLGVVLIRKKVTKQLNNNTSSILSLFFIAGFEANGNIQTLKFYGGRLATSANNSGVLIDTIAYSRLKNELEAMQIDKTDNRNFVPATGTKALDPYYWQEVDDAVEQYLANSQ